MHRLKQLVRSFTVLLLSFFFITYSSLPAFAEEPNESSPTPTASSTASATATATASPPTDSSTRGPQGPTGPQGQTGPQGPTGRVENYVDPTSLPSATPITNVQGSNDGTGPNSNNENNTSNNSTTNANSENNANLNNNVDVNATTGQIGANNNTSVGNIDTGNINGTVDVINIANSTLGAGSSVGSQTLSGSDTNAINLTPTGTRTSLDNTLTGPNSSNTNLLDNNHAVVINNGNNATANNGINVNADTGNIDLNSNTLVGNVSSGDINLALNTVNLLNIYAPNTVLALDFWNVVGNYNGDIIIPDADNTQTGPNSINTNTANNNNSTDINVSRDANIDNSLEVNANTGEVNLANNSKVGSVTTGDTQVNGTVTNIANVAKPVYYLINVIGKAGDWLKDEIAALGLGDNVIINEIANEETGPNSENSNDVDNNNTTEINNESNATANNKIKVNANTGKISGKNNSQIGDISTGSVKVASNVVNVLNSISDKVGDVSIRVVNIFGNFLGHIKGPKKETAAKPQDNASATTKKATQTTTDTSKSVSSVPHQNSDTTSQGAGLSQKLKSTFTRNKSKTTQESDDGKQSISESKQSNESINESVDESQKIAAHVSGESQDPDVMVKAYSTHSPDAGIRGLPKQLLYTAAFGGVILLLWGLSEVASLKQKK